MRYWLRFKHAECFGALLTRQQIGDLIPLLLACLGSACLFGTLFVSTIVAPAANVSSLSGLLAVLSGAVAIGQVRHLVGYLRRDSITMPPDLAHRIAPGMNWPQIGNNRRIWLLRALAGGSKRGTLWILAIGIWVIVLIGVQGILSGEFVPGVTHGG